MDKILFLTHWYPNDENTHKGIFIKNHAHCFDSFSDLTVVDFNISYAKRIYQSDVYRSNDDGLDVLHIHLKSRFYKFIYYSLIFQYILLKKIFKKEELKVEEYDLLVSNVIFPNGILAWKLASKFKKKLIHIEHWSYLKTFLTKDIHRRKGLKALDYASKIIVISNVLKKEFSNFNFDNKIDIIPNVVDSKFEYLKKLGSNSIRFLAIANWRKPKNPFNFIKALNELKNRNFNIKLKMIGEGEQLEEIKKMNLSFEIDFVGMVKNSELPFFFQEADFFIHGSDFETFSIVAIEALQTGTPVISSKVGVLPEEITDENGVLCDGNVESWVNSIEKAINCQYNHEMIAKKIKGKYSKERIAQLFEEIVRKTTDGDN